MKKNGFPNQQHKKIVQKKIKKNVAFAPNFEPKKLNNQEIFANKNLGQHFLFDQEILEKIAEPAEISPNDFILEIGPGLGTLTEILAKKAKKVLAVEFDENLAKKLREKFFKNEKVEIISQDFLRFDLTKLPKNYKIVANIPYNITGKIIEKILESENLPLVAVFLVQKEVAERIAANPGKMSILAVATQLKMNVELGIVVAPEKFSPPPKVQSQVVILRALKQPRFSIKDEKNLAENRKDCEENLAKNFSENLTRDFNEKIFLRVVKAGFSEKRKKLRSSLAGGLNLAKNDIERILTRAEISPERRAQELDLDDWRRIYESWELFSE